MATVQKSIRINEKTLKEIEKISRDSGREFSAITKELLEEALKMKRCPGIVFTEGTTGRRARIAGTGIEVWEVLATYKGVSHDFSRLCKAYHWLTEQQLRAAIGYYAIYTDEIDILIKQNEELDRKQIHEKYPFLNGIAAEPSTPTQAALAAIWAEVLEVGVVGADDDFFALGGDSIRAMRVVARVWERLGRDLSATTVLEQPTRAALAATLNAEGPAPIGALPEAMPSTRDVSPLSSGQERLWLAEQLDPGRPTYNAPLAFRLIGPLDVAALGRSLDAIVARHDALRATFLVAGDSPMQRIGPIAPPYLEVHDIRGGGDVPADERGRTLLEAEARRPFDLRRGPLIRCLLVRVADARAPAATITAGNNSVAGAAYLLEAMISGVSEPEAKALNDGLDGPALGAGPGESDRKGSVTYARIPAGARGQVYIYITHH